MKYYLLTTREYFYDGHGTPELGATCKMVTNSEEYQCIKEDGVYIEGDYYKNYLNSLEEAGYPDPDPNEFELIPEDYNEVIELSAEDGYNCTMIEYEFKEINYTQFLEYVEIINKYDEL